MWMKTIQNRLIPLALTVCGLFDNRCVWFNVGSYCLAGLRFWFSFAVFAANLDSQRFTSPIFSSSPINTTRITLRFNRDY